VREMMSMVCMLFMFGCSSSIKNKVTLGKPFPEVRGKSLFGDEVTIPQKVSDFQIILIGYKQKTQFDIDRWLIGFEMTGVKVLINELPVLNSWFPDFLQKRIDRGMKSGIPKNLWKNVMTVYDDAEIIKKFLGTENPNNARVVLLDPSQRVIAHYDNGFSSKSLAKILALLPREKSIDKCELF